MKRIVIFSLFLIFFGTTCKSEIPAFQAEEQTLISSLLKENQNLIEEMLKDKPNLVWKDFSDTNLKLVNSKHPKLREWGQTIADLLPSSNASLDDSMENISKIQEIISVIKVEVPGQSQYQKFYCPMVDKYWVMTGKEIRNPYAPEMRDCGELLP